MRVRAGEFPPPDPSVEQLAKGNFFQPLLRYYNKEREVTQVQMVPWSYLLMESSERAHGECSIHTGLRLPLGKNSDEEEQELKTENWKLEIGNCASATTNSGHRDLPFTFHFAIFNFQFSIPLQSVAYQGSEIHNSTS